MNNIRIGVWLFDWNKEEAGGGFSYNVQLIKKINEYSFKDAEIVFLTDKNYSNNKSTIKYKVIKWKPYRETRKSSFVSHLAARLHIKKRVTVIEQRIKKNEEELKNELNQIVDILYYPVSDCVFPNFPFIYTLWDIGHQSTYAFPEFSMNGLFEIRKWHHDFYVHKALMVFAESNAGKKEAMSYLNLNENRIKVIPLFPSKIVDDAIESIQPQEIHDDLFFIHYSAQYWVHKNHYNLILAFKQVLLTYPNLTLVLTGHDRGNKAYIKRVITHFGLDNQIIDLGFVKIEELKWLYKHSQGLVMPTFLGPTNMPLLEAAELGCSVACSNFDGHKEQLGDYGYYFNPIDSSNIAKTICEMIQDKQNNSVKTYKRVFTIDATLSAIDEAFTEIRNLRFCWGAEDITY